MGIVSLAGDQAASWPRLGAGRERLREYQLQNLRRVMTLAASRTPYYRRKLKEAGISPQDVRTWADFEAIPISEKADFQAAGFDERLAEGAGDRPDLLVFETSGSTGQVLRTAQAPEELTLYAGRRLRAMILSGLRPWSRRVHIASEVRKTAPHRLGIFRVEGAPLSADPEAMMSRIEAVGPHILKGPPGALELLALKTPERLAALRLQKVFAGAEQLSGKTRALVEQVSGTRLIDLYGAVECNLIAWECTRCGRYHTCDDAVIVELLCDGRPAEPGETGEVVVTALHSYRMPIVRYRIGDAARLPLDRIDCRIRFGVLERIEGRIVDYLDFGIGSPMSPYDMVDPLDEMGGVARYEIEQTARRTVVVRIEPARGAPLSETLHQAELQCRAKLPRGVSVRVEHATDLPLDPRRKRRYVKALPSL